MDWKKNLALAASAFVSMSVSSVANACANDLTAHKRLRRRRASVPVKKVSGQSIRVNVHMPLNKARRVPAACSSYKVDVTLLDIETGIKFHKVEFIDAGQGATMTLDWGSNPEIETIVPETAMVSASVEVTPTDTSCATIKPVMSFVLNDNGRGTFLPSQELDPVHLRPASLGGPIIIKDPKISF